jgi:hypothetical protein
MKLKIDNLDEFGQKALKIVFAIMAIVIMLSISYITYRFTFYIHRIQKETPNLDIETTCKNDTAYIYLGALTDVKAVKCTGLDSELFIKSEIPIGTLNYEDKDVCIFKLKSITSDPLRFEISFADNEGKSYTKREVCDWNMRKSSTTYY